MDIKSLLNNQLVDRKRAERLSQVSSDSKGVQENSSSKKSATDEFIISSTNSSDLSFAQSIYKKMDESSLDRVRTIRAKVESGYYTTDESIKKLASSLENDIYELDASNYSIESQTAYPIDIEQLKKNISENSDIYKEVAQRLSQILSKI